MTNAANWAENPVADRLLIQLEDRRDLVHGHELVGRVGHGPNATVRGLFWPDPG